MSSHTEYVLLWYLLTTRNFWVPAVYYSARQIAESKESSKSLGISSGYIHCILNPYLSLDLNLSVSICVHLAHLGGKQSALPTATFNKCPIYANWKNLSPKKQLVSIWSFSEIHMFSNNYVIYWALTVFVLNWFTAFEGLLYCYIAFHGLTYCYTAFQVRIYCYTEYPVVPCCYKNYMGKAKDQIQLHSVCITWGQIFIHTDAVHCIFAFNYNIEWTNVQTINLKRKICRFSLVPVQISLYR